jgi:UDP-N-acetylmuramoyl-L-alanyl-D-glutamate--2,6-diaminopimelate ligase
MQKLKKAAKKILPEYLFLFYHRLKAFCAVCLYGFPARKMIIIGITGTKGKTSTANYVWSVLKAGNYSAGLISTANFRLDDEEIINPYHMTMPDPFLIQSMLRKMYKKGITAVVVEMTSEGMKQYRHTGIPVDFAIFTNLTPEHLTSHKGDFELYKQAKSSLFKALSRVPKIIGGKSIPRTIIANADSEHAQYYLEFPADKKITYGITNGEVKASAVIETKTGTSFWVDGEQFELSIPGAFNIYNALPALIVGTTLGIQLENIRKGLKTLNLIPGRMERIDEGQEYTVFVDYAHEPASLGALLSTVKNIKAPDGKIILLFGGQGGGRDPRKRQPMAELAGSSAEYVIIANEDPYEDDPKQIVDDIANMVAVAGKKINENLFAILDRKEGIRKALSLAKSGDIVLITGKGAETTMMVKGGSIPWNEREIVRQLIQESLAK